MEQKSKLSWEITIVSRTRKKQSVWITWESKIKGKSDETWGWNSYIYPVPFALICSRRYWLVLHVFIFVFLNICVWSFFWQIQKGDSGVKVILIIPFLEVWFPLGIQNFILSTCRSHLGPWVLNVVNHTPNRAGGQKSSLLPFDMNTVWNSEDSCSLCLHQACLRMPTKVKH